MREEGRSVPTSELYRYRKTRVGSGLYCVFRIASLSCSVNAIPNTQYEFGYSYEKNPFPVLRPSCPAVTFRRSNGHGRYLSSPRSSCSTSRM